MIDIEAQIRKYQEIEFARKHKQDSDEMLLCYVRYHAQKLGRIPLKQDIVGFSYIKTRLGPWPRVLEKAGLKEITENRKNKLAKKAAKKNNTA